MLEAFWQSVQVFILARFRASAVQFWSKLRALLDSADSFVAAFGKDNNKLAQVGHFSVSYGLTFTAYTVGWVFNAWYAGLIVGAVLGGPWVIWKEVFRDTRPPESDPFAWPGGLEDAIFYWAGILTATGIAAAIGMAFPR